MGVWQAILHYEVRRGVAFSTYAGRVIRNQIWNAVSKGWKAQGWLEGERGAGMPWGDASSGNGELEQVSQRAARRVGVLAGALAAGWWSGFLG